MQLPLGLRAMAMAAHLTSGAGSIGCLTSLARYRYRNSRPAGRRLHDDREVRPRYLYGLLASR